jgi:hypothetical protein
MEEAAEKAGQREFAERVAEWIQVIVLIAVGLFGLVATVVQFVLRDPKWLQDNPSVVLAVLSFIALHLAVDRTIATRRTARASRELAMRLQKLEMRVDAREDDYLEYLRATGHYIRVLAVRRYLKGVGRDGYPDLSSELLREPFTLLESLANGRIDIPEGQIPAIQSALGLRFKETFEAVSDDDLDFWLDTETNPVAAGYFEQNITAIRRGTKVSRIFITTLRALETRLADLARILERQETAGVAWGVCLRDDFDSDVKNKSDAKTDFALFNGDELAT